MCLWVQLEYDDDDDWYIFQLYLQLKSNDFHVFVNEFDYCMNHFERVHMIAMFVHHGFVRNSEYVALH